MKMLFLKYLGFFQVMPNSQIQAIQNLGTALITMGAGSIVDEYAKYKQMNFQELAKQSFIPNTNPNLRHGYYWLMNFFLFWLLVTLACTVCIWISDWSVCFCVFFSSMIMNLRKFACQS